jgi:hypothetical protein
MEYRQKKIPAGVVTGVASVARVDGLLTAVLPA